jgi:uncharacterized membrane protein
MVQSIISHAEAVIAFIASLIALWQKIRSMKKDNALKFSTSAIDQLLPYVKDTEKTVDQLKDELAKAQEFAKVRGEIIESLKQVRHEKVNSKEFKVGVDIDNRGKPTAQAGFSWRF